MINELPLYLFPVLLIVAVAYSAVGHGGASGYLALMAIAGCTMSYAKPVALVLNCIVSIIAFLQYYKAGYFNANLFAKLALASIPFAYLGGLVHLDEVLYKRVLGVILLLTSLRFFFEFKEKEIDVKAKSIFIILVGAVIGFVSGLIGIGGGIFLTPLMLLMGWSNMRVAACVSALFIFVNSISGLLAQMGKGFVWFQNSYYLVGVVVFGGIIGSYFGAKKWDVSLLKKVLSIVLLIASIKLIFI